jgi:hypothetical protein
MNERMPAITVAHELVHAARYCAQTTGMGYPVSWEPLMDGVTQQTLNGSFFTAAEGQGPVSPLHGPGWESFLNGWLP